jgi:hypothetical protein
LKQKALKEPAVEPLATISTALTAIAVDEARLFIELKPFRSSSTTPRACCGGRGALGHKPLDKRDSSEH